MELPQVDSRPAERLYPQAFQGTSAGRWGPLALLCVLLLPAFLLNDRYILGAAAYVLLFVMLAIGLQVTMGLAGQVSLAHAAFYGIGAYTTAILMTRWQLPFLVALPVAVGMTVVGALLMSPVVRLEGPYFSLATLAFGITVHLVINNSGRLTGGSEGLSGIPPADLFGYRLTSANEYYAALLMTTWLLYLAVRRLVNSPVGRALRMIREDSLAAAHVGVDVARFKIAAIAVGAACAGLAGAFLGPMHGFISPEPFSITHSFMMLIMVVAGGIGSLPGSVLGAALLVSLDRLLAGLPLVKPLLYGGLVVAIMTLLPNGLAGLSLRRPAPGGDQT